MAVFKLKLFFHAYLFDFHEFLSLSNYYMFQTYLQTIIKLFANCDVFVYFEVQYVEEELI